MINSKATTVNRSLIVAAALIVGELMPYLARIPLAFVYGAAWIWRHTPDLDNFLRWNGMHLGSLIPIAIFGLIYIYSSNRSAFYASVISHLAITSLLYYSHGQPYGPDDFLGCFIYPFIIGIGSLACGFIALFASALLTRLQSGRSVTEA